MDSVTWQIREEITFLMGVWKRSGNKLEFHKNIAYGVFLKTPPLKIIQRPRKSAPILLRGGYPSRGENATGDQVNLAKKIDDAAKRWRRSPVYYGSA